MPEPVNDREQLTLTLRPAREEDVRAFLLWRYEAPYDIYSIHPSDPINREQLEKNVRYFLNPDYACHTMFDAHGNLVGYCTFGRDAQVPGGDYSADALDIGMGVHPDWIGQGYGITFVHNVLDFAARQFAPDAFRVTVAEFNTRALRVWQKAGFSPVQTFIRTRTNRPFVVLMRLEKK